MQGRFAETVRTVCEKHRWQLLPTGVLIEWGDGRKQLVSIEPFEFEREELVRFSSLIGSIESLSHGQLVRALRSNNELAHGALAIVDDQLCVVDTLLIADADPAVVEASIEFLARSADEYERVVFGTDAH